MQQDAVRPVPLEPEGDLVAPRRQPQPLEGAVEVVHDASVEPSPVAMKLPIIPMSGLSAFAAVPL
jgi:hypothetical protein